MDIGSDSNVTKSEGGVKRVQKMPQSASAAELAPALMIELMTAVATKRDRNAFMKLFDYYAPRVKSFLMSLRASDSIAEDLTQEVLYTVWSKAELFQSQRGSVNAWVFTIARNRYVDQIRRSRKPAIDPEEYALMSEAPAEADELIERQQNVEKLRAGLSELPPEQEEVVRMCFLEGKTQREISDELGIPLGTVKSRSRLAFSRLRSILGEVM